MAKERIELRIDEASELVFTVSVEAPEPVVPAYRLAIEGTAMGLTFRGHSDGQGSVRFVVPALKGRLDEGCHPARLEVVLGDRYFAPVELEVELTQPARVTVESVAVTQQAAGRAFSSAPARASAKPVAQPAARAALVSAAPAAPATAKEQPALPGPVVLGEGAEPPVESIEADVRTLRRLIRQEMGAAPAPRPTKPRKRAP